MSEEFKIPRFNGRAGSSPALGANENRELANAALCFFIWGGTCWYSLRSQCLDLILTTLLAAPERSRA